MCMYVPRCHRMDYKVQYGPCELLCPTFWDWVPYTPDVAARIAANRNTTLADMPGVTPADMNNMMTEAAMSVLPTVKLHVAPPLRRLLALPPVVENVLVTDVLEFAVQAGPANLTRFVLDVSGALQHVVAQMERQIRAQRQAAAAAASAAAAYGPPLPPTAPPHDDDSGDSNDDDGSGW